MLIRQLTTEGKNVFSNSMMDENLAPTLNFPKGKVIFHNRACSLQFLTTWFFPNTTIWLPPTSPSSMSFALVKVEDVLKPSGHFLVIFFHDICVAWTLLTSPSFLKLSLSLNQGASLFFSYLSDHFLSVSFTELFFSVSQGFFPSVHFYHWWKDILIAWSGAQTMEPDF